MANFTKNDAMFIGAIGFGIGCLVYALRSTMR